MSPAAWGGRFLDALAFLSRLAPPRSFTAQSLAASVPWFAPAGLALGCLCTLAAWLALTILSTATGASHAMGTAWPAAALAAWLWLALELWSTRGLHWDGLADLGDACGSGASGARFREILRDSRLGAFGALSLLLIFPDSLGGLACAGAGPTVRRVYRLGALLLVCLLAALGLSLWQGLVLIVAQYCLTRRLAAQARSHGGLSGDFLGAAIELGQLWFLLATL